MADDRIEPVFVAPEIPHQNVTHNSSKEETKKEVSGHTGPADTPFIKSAWTQSLHELRIWEPLLSASASMLAAIGSVGTLLVALLALSYYKPEAEKQVDDANRSAAQILFQAQTQLKNAQATLNNANSVNWLADKENSREEKENEQLNETNRALNIKVVTTTNQLSKLNSQIEEAKNVIRTQNMEISFLTDEERHVISNYNASRKRIAAIDAIKSNLELSLTNDRRRVILETFLSELRRDGDGLGDVIFFQSNDVSLPTDRVFMMQVFPGESFSNDVQTDRVFKQTDLFDKRRLFFYSQGLSQGDFEEPLFYGFPDGSIFGIGGFGQKPAVPTYYSSEFQFIDHFCPDATGLNISDSKMYSGGIEFCKAGIVPKTLDPLRLYVLLIAQRVMMDIRLRDNVDDYLDEIDPGVSFGLRALDMVQGPKNPEVVYFVNSPNQVPSAERNNPNVKINVIPKMGTTPNPLSDKEITLIVSIANQIADEAIKIQPLIQGKFEPIFKETSTPPNTTGWRVDEVNNNLYCNWSNLLINDQLLANNGENLSLSEEKSDLLNYFFVQKPRITSGNRFWNSLFGDHRSSNETSDAQQAENENAMAQEEDYEGWNDIINSVVAPGISYNLALALVKKSLDIDKCFNVLEWSAAELERELVEGKM